MRIILAVFFGLLLLAAGQGRALAAPPDPSGYWVTGKGEGVVQIYPCGGDARCGALVGFQIDHPQDPTPQTWDHHSQCRFVFIVNLHPRTRAWMGSIIDPKSGHHYSAKVRVMSANQLRLRGYFLLPMLGATRFWTRYTGPTPPADCRMPPNSLE
ncbi:DUF2147 domain-containing protein [Acidisoma cellulosilytica]|uniref:DUF2147 domain-containing protein n=1 Tax=Acidisoma cellulosilyticum TaxID=2802395 RepID=A0A963Z076_9PROT|nr:DUF2147 domain-containing protein [Acidisoma cellulosilyticum]MCB8880300.1 DUF2147 domain-containing protein [Acidisoma cellulosilyticum]